MEEYTKVKDLNPGSRKVTVLAKVLSVGETRQIQTRYGESKNVTEAILGDDTGKVTMSLWEDQVNLVSPGDTIVVENGYVSFKMGHMRLNVGKYGSIKKSDSELKEINESLDMSEKEYPREETERRPRRDFGGGRNFRRRF